MKVKILEAVMSTPYEDEGIVGKVVDATVEVSGYATILGANLIDCGGVKPWTIDFHYWFRPSYFEIVEE